MAGLREKVPRNAWAYLSRPDMVQGRWSGGILTLWVGEEVVKRVVERPAVLEAVRAQAQAQLGRPVQVRVQQGRAPEEPSGGSAGTHDPLENLLARGQQCDNIIIKE